MTETPGLGLPLLSPAQAQKHVTVNEALLRLDALAQLTLVSREAASPPADAAEGQVWAVPPGASDDWQGAGGRLALRLNNGWSFVTPQPGWRAWIADEGVPAIFDGETWTGGAGSIGASGAATVMRVVERDHALAAGAVSDTDLLIPSHAIVLGVTARILEDTGSAWSLGTQDAPDRYGTGYGGEAGAWARGLTSQPLTYWSETALRLTAEEGAFTGGRILIAVHLAELTLPRG